MTDEEEGAMTLVSGLLEMMGLRKIEGEGAHVAAVEAAAAAAAADDDDNRYHDSQ